MISKQANQEKSITRTNNGLLKLFKNNKIFKMHTLNFLKIKGIVYYVAKALM
jgi:hypothetical protein